AGLCAVRRPLSRSICAMFFPTSARIASRQAARRAGGSRSASSEPPEPGEIGLPGPALAGLPFEQLFRLAQDQGVRPPRAPCFVAHGELGGIDPLMNVSPALFGERPFEPLANRIGEEVAQPAAELATAAVRKGDRPVARAPRRPGQPGLQPPDAMSRQ